MNAMNTALLAITNGAQLAVAAMVDNRALLYRKRPAQLDVDIPNLGASMMTGRQLVAIADHFLEHGGAAYSAPRDIRNLRAARLHGQWLIDEERQAA